MERHWEPYKNVSALDLQCCASVQHTRVHAELPPLFPLAVPYKHQLSHVWNSQSQSSSILGILASNLACNEANNCCLCINSSLNSSKNHALVLFEPFQCLLIRSHLPIQFFLHLTLNVSVRLTSGVRHVGLRLEFQCRSMACGPLIRTMVA